jgi:AraC-like DNA-binding protein
MKSETLAHDGAAGAVSMRVAGKVIDRAAARGVDAASLCAAAGIDLAVMTDAKAKLTVAQYYRLWVVAMARVKDPGFVLDVASVGDEWNDLVHFACMTSDTVWEMFERACRYLPLACDAFSWSVDRIGSRAVFRIEAVGGRQPETRFFDEYSAARVVALSRRFVGVDWHPLEVRFTHQPPSDLTRHRAFFGAPIVFGADAAELHFSSDDLTRPLVKRDPAMTAFFSRYADRALERVHSARLAVAVRRRIIERLPEGTASIENVAGDLDVSARTLRRQLAVEGTTFQRLLDEKRKELAQKYLTSGGRSLLEISLALGFSDVTAFHRAFRRWMGTTPTGFMRRRASRRPSA